VKWLAAALMLSGLPATAGPRDALQPYPRCFYDREVLQYCGIWSDVLAKGAELACAEAREAAALDEEAAFRARVQAAVAFDDEWQNRSNSGKRQWCLGEGRAAALFFFDRALREHFKEPAGLAKETVPAPDQVRE
jgi:predicted Zn-dependent protease